MTTSPADLKRLWGRAAGRCSHPECGVECLTFLESENSTVIGEMAHIVARSPAGPRGKSRHPDDGYSNLILLCPTHHTLVDKAPREFPAQMLLKWKAEHERAIHETLAARMFSDRTSFNDFAHKLLAENHACWATYGPESTAAQQNPNSTAGYFWPFRKLSVIVPNNRRLIARTTSTCCSCTTRRCSRPRRLMARSNRWSDGLRARSPSRFTRSFFRNMRLRNQVSSKI